METGDPEARVPFIGMTIWFTADLHLGHRNIIRHAKRPFASLEEMEQHIYGVWRKLVRRDDEIYLIGDVSFYKPSKIIEILESLPGRKYVLKGNHDNHKTIKKVAQSGVVEWVKDRHELKYKGEFIVLDHYPLEVWNKSHYGSWHLHGHCHGSLVQTRDIKRMDVGVDTHPEFRPYSFDEIKALLDQRGYEPVDQHTRR